MAIEHVDVQWTVVCRFSFQAAITAVMARAEALGWLFEDLEIKDWDGACLFFGDEWPPETMGSTRYLKQKSEGEEFSLFWSTRSSSGLCKITGGLYIKQYATDRGDFLAACDRAIDDLQRLFDGDEVLCVVLTLEDDEGIDIAPGIVGFYRPSLWGVSSHLNLKGVTWEARKGWVEVRPDRIAYHQGVFIIAEAAAETQTIRTIQSALETGLWGR